MPEAKWYVENLSNDLIFLPNQKEIRVYEWRYTGGPSGGLLMLRGSFKREFFVVFFGGKDVRSVIDKAYEAFRAREVNWKPDQYRSTIGEK